MLQGHQSWVFQNKPVILSSAAIVGPDEGKGPLKDEFDIVHSDLTVGQKSWRKRRKHCLRKRPS